MNCFYIIKIEKTAPRPAFLHAEKMQSRKRLYFFSGVQSSGFFRYFYFLFLNFRGGGRGERNGGRPSGSFCRFTLYRLNDLKKRQKGRAAPVKGAQTPRGGNKSLQGSKRNAPALQEPNPSQINLRYIYLSWIL